jgi:hypothetical protein
MPRQHVHSAKEIQVFVKLFKMLVSMTKIGTQSLSKNYQTSLHIYDTVEHQQFRKE